MALTLSISWTVLNDASRIYPYDSTYSDSGSGAWGVGSNPNRSERCLIFFCKYIDYEGNESYLDMASGYVGTQVKVGVAPGAGLSNTDESTFEVISPKDGHHALTMIPIVQQASAPGAPSAYDMYYNTTDGIPYIYVDGAWTQIAAANLQYAEDDASAKICEKLFDFRIAMKRNNLIFKIGDDDRSDDANYEEKLDELEALMEAAWSKFEGGLKPTARKLLEKARKVSVNY